MSEWISVKDRLPEKSGYHLVYYAFTERSEPLICKRYFHEEAPDVFVHRKEMTHWMPLPEPPKGERGNDHAENRTKGCLQT